MTDSPMRSPSDTRRRPGREAFAEPEAGSSARGRLLIVDDEDSVRDSLKHWFETDDLEVLTAEDGNVALRALEGTTIDVALVDLKMPGMDGLELQQRIRAFDPEIAVIVITAFATVETAVRALKEGAFDYVTKPIDPDELSHVVARALESHRLKRENTALRQAVDDLAGGERIVGESPAILRVQELVRSVAGTDATVLIRGESGTGKELIARAIHAQSRRRYFPIVPVNCGAFPDDLLESELFGHEKGAFTGAQYRHRGKLEMADRGTLFLDEIGAIPPRMQVDLLRVLETKEFTRLGGSRPVRVDFRVVCATNEDLEQAVREGRFREDLYYRLDVFGIEAPPLRERPGDIPLLAEHFRQRFADRMDKHLTAISPEAMELLVAHRWPGNVRELSNAIERAMVVGQPPAIRPGDLPIRASGAPAAKTSLAEIEKQHVSRTLSQTEWNITRTAEVLGVDRATVYAKIKKYGLSR